MCDKNEPMQPMTKSDLMDRCNQYSYALARQRGLMTAEEGAEPCKHWMICKDFKAAVKEPEE